MPVASSTILADTLFFVKDFLETNITDPITRPGNQNFVMTSYPVQPVQYPLITVKDVNMNSIPLGLQSEAQLVDMTIEIRVWANSVAQRDRITQEILNDMRTNQIGVTGTSQAADLHDFRLLNQVNIDEPNGPKSKVMQIKFIFIST